MEQVETGQLEQEVYRLISKSFIDLDEGDRQLMRRFGLTINQYWALVHLDDAEGRSLSELAHLLLCDKSNVTSIVDKLERAELARRERGKAGDRRYTRVVLTARGQQLRTILISARDHMVEARLRVLQTHDLHQLYSSLEKLAKALESQFEGGEVTHIIENSIKQGYTST
jgi:DNA-binding MarR family transcriptional regulator